MCSKCYKETIDHLGTKSKWAIFDKLPFAAWLDAIRAEEGDDYHPDSSPDAVEGVDIQGAVHLILGGELAKHAVSEGTKAVVCVACLAPGA
jgi:hypothetical protein